MLALLYWVYRLMRVLVEELKDLLTPRHMMIATAESCTGGLIAATITDLPGSSSIFDRGFVTYTNDAKSDMLGVDPAQIQEYGAVSAEVATAMVAGALTQSNAGLAVSCTGIAGPGGATESKPVGLVYIGLAGQDSEPRAYKHHFDGDRVAIRQKTVEQALNYLIDFLKSDR